MGSNFLPILRLMKIGFDAKRVFNNRTGLGNYSRTLIEGLTKEYPENEYHLYTPSIKLEENFLQRNLRVFRHFPTDFIDKKIPSFWRSNSLVKDLLRDEIQLFHGLSNELPQGIEQSEIKSVVTIHDLIFLHFPDLYPWVDRQLYQKKFSSAIQRASCVIAASEQTKQDILKYYPCDSQKVKVVYQACHPIFGMEATSAQKDLVKLNFGLNRNFILSVGTLEKRKNHLNLVKAFHLAKFEDIDLCLVGKKADAYPLLMKYIHENKLEDRVHFLHDISLEDLQCLYQTARIAAYISNFEGFGIPVIEAFSSHLPILCSNKSSIPEVAGNAALMVDPNNIKQISQGLQTLIFQESEREAYILAMKKQLSLFDPVFLTHQIANLYKGLLN